MDQSIYLKNIQVLKEFSFRLKRFGNEVYKSTQSLNYEIKIIINWIEGHYRSCQNAVSRCRNDIDYAKQALTDCYNSEDEDYEPDCSYEEECLQDAYDSLRRAESNLQEAQHWRYRIFDTIERLRIQLSRILIISTERNSKAVSFLNNGYSKLEAYFTESNPQTEISTIDSGVDKVDINIETNLNEKSQSKISTLTYSNVTKSEKIFNSDRGNPITEQVKSNFIEKGIQWISLSNLPMPKDISEKNFQKVSVDQIKGGLAKIPEIKKAIDDGYGSNKDYWRKKDEELGLNYTEGYLSAYEGFFSETDPIRIEKVGSKYNIISGRHRIWLANKMGLEKIPVSLIERK